MNENYSKIIEQDSEIISFEFYKLNKIKLYLYYFGVVITLGILFLPFYWWEHFNYIFYDLVEEENNCTHVMFHNKHN